MNEQDQQKRKAAERAVELIEDGMKLGLGTGSTARHVLEVIAERRKAGLLRDIVGVATSKATSDYAQQLGIPIRALEDAPQLDLGIDGADEVDGDLNLIKGLGGALLWEKIVAAACDRFVVVVDETKLVQKLGTKGPLPVEVVQFGWSLHLPAIKSLGGRALLRRNKDGSGFITDGGHFIIDCAFGKGIAKPHELEAELKSRPGIVESGLFLDMASAVIVAGAGGTRVLERGE